VSPAPAVRGCLRLARDVVEVVGPQAGEYLQGQLSQDLAALEVGEARFSFVLQPQGKVDAFVRVTRVADERFVLDVDAGWGDAVLARLKRFLLRTKAEVRALDWAVVAVRGETVPAPDGAFAVPPETPGVVGVDLLGPGLDLDRIGEPALPVLDGATYDALRIRAGVPRMGAELDESTIPASAGVVDRAVSFTKGCYTGQELVARIDARGDRVPTRLRILVADPGTSLEVGEAVEVDGRAVGRVTSAAGEVALAYVRREVDVPGGATVGGHQVRVEALPLPPAP
jgi:folate-binding protein YgfZ